MIATKKRATHTPNNNVREFTFSRGIAGFSNATRFAFIYEGKGDMVCLQSIDQPEASFILTPWDESRIGNPPQLSKEQLSCLKVDNDHHIFWMLVLNPFADKKWVTANLKAPIAISDASQTGLQCIRNDNSLALRHPWIPQPTSA